MITGQLISCIVKIIMICLEKNNNIEISIKGEKKLGILNVDVSYF